MLLTKENILSATDLRAELVEVPEWGGTVRVRALSSADRDAFETAYLAEGGIPANLRARLAVLSIVDDEGNRLFGDEDLGAVGALEASAVNRVFEAAQKLSGFTAGDIEELAGSTEA